MRANGLAYRLKRIAAIVVFLGAFGCNRHQATVAASVKSDTVDMTPAAKAFRNYYETENIGAEDAYRTLSLRRGLRIGNTEDCILPTGIRSVRPSVIANPPLSAASIEQRAQVFQLVGSFLDVVRPDVLDHRRYRALSQLRNDARLFSQAANLHSQGDLFINDESERISRALMGTVVSDLNGKNVALRSIDRTLQELLVTIAADFASHQVAASRNAVMTAIMVYDKKGRPGSSPPFCSEPAEFLGANLLGPTEAKATTDTHEKTLRLRLESLRPAPYVKLITASSAALIAADSFLDNTHDKDASARLAVADEALMSAEKQLPVI